MKKLISISILFVSSIILVACQKQINIPSVSEGDQVIAGEPITDATPVSTNEITRVVPANYMTYDASLVKDAALNGKAVLFFHASWCPTCQALDKELISNISQLPNNVTIFKVDYDSETELKTKYAVTYQHTLVQVDTEGNSITKWNGGGVAEINQNLK